ncbi:MAG: hypothetical protein KDA42_14350 [Planctomycetales bacterium]|nr:hypothetical protein [Planctomycetales bacterium]
MSPFNENIDTVDSESVDMGPRLSDTRRVSLALAFSPARQRRRKAMYQADSWFRRSFGLGRRRSSRAVR